MGPLALGMVGMVCLSPVLSNVIAPVISPILTAIGSDPAIFGAILPNDTGGYSLALSLAQNEQAGLYSGLIVASMLGSTVTFSIPVGLNLIAKKETPYFNMPLVKPRTYKEMEHYAKNLKKHGIYLSSFINADVSAI